MCESPMAQQTQLQPYSETAFETKAPEGYPVSCPTLDLSTTWDGDGRNVLIYRPPNQVVSKIHQVGAPGQKAPEAVAVTWKPDGQFLAVGWSDGYVRLMGLENNKTAHHLPVCQDRDARITHISWACNRIEGSSGPGGFSDSLREGLRKLRREGIQTDEAALVNLPRELTFMEVETALPKLSPLPSGSAGGGDDAMVFTLRSGIEFLFQTRAPEDHDQVNVMIVGTSDGKLQLSIEDSFIIGTLDIPAPNSSPALQLVRHTAHSHVSTHALLLAEKTSEPDAVHVVPLDLPFISSSPINLSLLADKLTTLQKLLRYIKQAQLHMQVEWRNTRELPSRFLRSVQGDLEQMESGPPSVAAALFHTVLTGHAHEPVREWLVESVAERGHKRWDKAVAGGLENLRSLIHENFLPALDRCAIILSRLKGLAQFHDRRDDIGFTAAHVSRVMDTIACLRLVGHKVLLHTMTELDCFVAFSGWLRFQIDRFASSSAESDELTEKEAAMDNAKILTYIRCYLAESPLRGFFDDISDEDCIADLGQIADAPSLLEIVDKHLKKAENGQSNMKALLHVEFLVNHAIKGSNRVFEDIADAKKRILRFGKPARLSLEHPITQMDMRMCKTAEGARIFTALTAKAANSKITIFHTTLTITNGISTTHAPVSCTIDLHPHKLTTFQFLDDQTLLVLATGPDNAPKLIRVPVHPEKLPYADAPGQSGASCDRFVVYSFPETPAFRPVAIEVHEWCDVRGEMPARVCLLESNRTTMRSFAIP